MTHWHDVNPWRDAIVYVPLEELAACVAGGTISDLKGNVWPYDVPWLLSHWAQCGRDKLDGYILPQPSGDHSIGVRYGAECHEYYSPMNRNRELTQKLLDKYRPRELMIQLDMALTGKARHVAEHTARGQESFGPLGEHIYYLSDGGYSRVVLNDSEWPRLSLFVASESLDRVKAAWPRPDVQTIVAAISAAMLADLKINGVDHVEL